MAKMRKEYDPNKVKQRKRKPIIYIICEGKETELEWRGQKSSVIQCYLVPKNPHFPYKMGQNGLDDTGRYGEDL